MSILLDDITKRYDGYAVVNHVSLEIQSGEFFVLLGSSGSGKTTVLNLIAGLVPLDAGRIALHGRDVTHLPVQQRRVGFVFQHYALFQHMTVAENIDFGPSVHRVAKAERRKRLDELLELVGLTGLGGRMPRQLSGGQQQRVALARALALQPDVLLLDEPLGALDAKIRAELRRNLRAIQRRLGITAILVTHDQEEAYDLADRIGVMSYGRLLEVASPQELYQQPQTEFVASFLGTANLLVGDYRDSGITIGGQYFSLPGRSNQVERRVQVLFRPEDVALCADPEGLGCASLGQGEVEEISFGGPVERLRLRLPPSPGVRPIAPPVPFGAQWILVDAARDPDSAAREPLNPGDRVHIGIRRLHALSNPGLSAVIVTDGTPASRPALDLGGHIARLSHARVTLLGCKAPPNALSAYLEETRKELAQGLASLEVRALPAEPAAAVIATTERVPHDLVVLAFDPRQQMRLAEQILASGEHHLLLAPGPCAAPTKALICVASGEPGKEDVFFTGRLMRHLGAESSLVCILPPVAGDATVSRRQAELFLSSGLQSLALLGARADSQVLAGPVAETIVQTAKAGGYDLVVLGAPLPRPDGELSLDGVVADVLTHIGNIPVLIVRSHYSSPRPIVRFRPY